MNISAIRNRTAVRTAAAAGLLAFAALVIGLALDVRAFDPTHGGYEPPYTDYRGEPIDWSTLQATPTGMMRKGHVVDVRVDCGNGMIHLGILGLEVPFRPLWERALVVHRPREGCRERGFEPGF